MWMFVCLSMIEWMWVKTILTLNTNKSTGHEDAELYAWDHILHGAHHFDAFFLEVCSFDPHSAWHTVISVLRPALPLCNILPFLRSLPDFWDISQPLWTLWNRKTQRPVGVPAVKFGAWLCQHDGARQRRWEHQRGTSTHKTKQPGEFFEAMYGNVDL